MRIIICVKQALVAYTELKAAEGELHPVDPVNAVNECDLNALEEALLVRNKFGGQVTAVTLGPLTSLDVLIHSLAMGVDRAIRINPEGIPLANPFCVAAALADVIKTLEYDLIFTGVQAVDDMFCQVGIQVAEQLGLPHVFAAMRVEPDPSRQLVTVAKEIGEGLLERVEVQMPAMLTFQSGINQPHYVSVLKKMQARSKAIQTVTLGDTSEMTQFRGKLKIVGISRPKRVRTAQIIGGKPEDIALKLLEKLTEAKVI
jgi:electron transfer flavoprotein beta subunit